MSGIIILKQPDALYLLTDGASYQMPSGVLTSIGAKVAVLPDDTSMAIFTQGPAGSRTWPHSHLWISFRRSTASLLNAGAHVRKWYLDHEDWMRAGGQPDLVFYFFGYSDRRKRVEGYMIRCAYDKSAFDRDGKVSRNGLFWNRKVKLKPFQALLISGNFSISPSIFTKDDLAAAGFPVHLQPKDLVPEVDVLQVLEMMRRKPCARFPNQPARILVGGHALLTRIDAHGVTQKVLAEYDGVIGAPVPIAPPLDWQRWRDGALFRHKLRTPANSNLITTS